MANIETKFTIDDTVSWKRDPENKMIITGIYIDKNQIQYNCRPINKKFAASYFFELDLQPAD